MLAKHFEIKDVCELTHFLGVKIVQKSDTGEIWIGQNVPKNVLEKLEMENSKPVSTLVDLNSNSLMTKEDWIQHNFSLLLVVYFIC